MNRFRFQPQLECLEIRDVPATFTIQVDPDVVLVTQDNQTTTYNRAGAVAIAGTDADDVVTVHFTSGQQVALFFDGKAGRDSLIVDGTDGNDTLVCKSISSFITGTTVARFTGFESQQFDGGGGYDTAWFYGTSRRDKFVHTASYDYLLNRLTFKNATGFERIEARLSSSDVAFFYDSAGTDIFAESGNYARLMDLYKTYSVGVQGEGALNLNGPKKGANVMMRPNSFVGYSFSAAGFTDLASFMRSHGADNNVQRLATLLDPSLAHATSSLDLAIRLRNQVYQSYVLGVNSTFFSSYDPETRYINCLVRKDDRVLCQGAQMIYDDLLNAFGIKHRLVYLWAHDKVSNHASVEIFSQGQWIVQDPTFGVAFRGADGAYLSYSQLKSVDWSIDRGGYTLRGDRTPIEKYYVSIDDLVTYIKFTPGPA